MKLQFNKYFKNSGTVTLIYYHPDITVNKNHEENSNSLKAYIKTQLGESNSKSISFYVPVFKTGSSEILLKFLTLL